MRFTPHFSLAEMEASQVALRRGIDNRATADARANLQRLCVDILQPLRDEVGPIVVTSGYRCLALNRAIGGAERSQHMSGQAADIIVPGWTPMDVAAEIRNMNLPFDQLIHEGTWTHVSWSPSPRGNILTARFAGGAVSYTGGLQA